VRSPTMTSQLAWTRTGIPATRNRVTASVIDRFSHLL
jgi:hypothetical protein